jgi:hypothetical protein
VRGEGTHAQFVGRQVRHQRNLALAEKVLGIGPTELLDVEEGDAGIVRHGQVQDGGAVEERDDVIVTGNALHCSPGAGKGVASDQRKAPHQAQASAAVLQGDG